jgi:hypothetical protein
MAYRSLGSEFVVLIVYAIHRCGSGAFSHVGSRGEADHDF